MYITLFAHESSYFLCYASAPFNIKPCADAIDSTRAYVVIIYGAEIFILIIFIPLFSKFMLHV